MNTRNLWYLSFSLLSSIGTVGHVAREITSLGSIQFLAPEDARIIIGRFVVPAVVCRAVLAGLRGHLEVTVEVEHPSTLVTHVPPLTSDEAIPLRQMTI